MTEIRKRSPADQQGTVVIVVAVGLMTLMGMVGLAVDLGYLYLTKCELQRAADAGATAGARALFFPATASPPQCSQATSTGTTIAQANLVDGAAPSITTIQTGRWDWTAQTFTPGCSSGTSTFSDAVAITVSKGNISLFIMGMFGYGALTLTASATAVTDFVGSLPPGTIPVSVNQNAYAVGQQLDINFSNDPMDNGGWFVPSGYSANASTLRGFINQTSPMPGINIGDSINLDNGVVTSALQALQTQLAAHNNSWDVAIPVVATTKFNHSDNIDGFINFRITQVKDTGNPKYIRGTVTGVAEAPGAGPGGINLNLVTQVKLVN